MKGREPVQGSGNGKRKKTPTDILDTTVAGLFAEYIDKIFTGMPKLAPDSAQFIETRRAFYAGAFIMLTTFNRIGDDDVDETDGAELMERLWQECQAFYRDVKAGTK